MVKDKRWTKLSELDKLIYNDRIDRCINCVGLDKCGTTENGIKLGQDMNGIMPVLYSYDFGTTKPTIKIQDKYCPYKQKKIDRVNVTLSGSYRDKILLASKHFLDKNQLSVLEKIKSNGKGFLFGTTGVGKSTAMECIAKELYDEGKSVTFELASNITTSLWSFENKEKNMIKYQRDDVLIIDDFAREKLTAHTILNVWSPIIQNRIDNNKPLYMTSNYSLIELWKIIKGLTDEIAADTIIHRLRLLGENKLEGIDYRLK